MRALSKNRFLIVVLFALLALPGCDLFNNDEEVSPTSPPALANVVAVGQATVQASAAGFAEYLGQVLNTGTVTARNVRVSINVYDASGNLIDVGTTTAVPSDLGSQATATYKVTTTTALAQAITFQIVIEWD